MKTFMLSYPDTRDANETRYIFEIAETEFDARKVFRETLNCGRLPNFSKIIELQVDGAKISESRDATPIQIDWNDELVTNFAYGLWNIAQDKFLNQSVSKEDKKEIYKQIQLFKRKNKK